MISIKISRLALPLLPAVLLVSCATTVEPPKAQLDEARTIAARVAGRREPGPFRYRDRGTMAAVGPRKAVVDIHGLRVGGLAGSVIWAFVHILYLVGWGNRLVTGSSSAV